MFTKELAFQQVFEHVLFWSFSSNYVYKLSTSDNCSFKMSLYLPIMFIPTVNDIVLADCIIAKYGFCASNNFASFSLDKSLWELFYIVIPFNENNTEVPHSSQDNEIPQHKIHNVLHTHAQLSNQVYWYS